MASVPAPGDPIRVEVLGEGVVEGRVREVREVRPMGGLPGMVWRMTVDLPGGAVAEAVVQGDAPPAFADPRHRLVP